MGYQYRQISIEGENLRLIDEGSLQQNDLADDDNFRDNYEGNSFNLVLNFMGCSCMNSFGFHLEQRISGCWVISTIILAQMDSRIGKIYQGLGRRRGINFNIDYSFNVIRQILSL